MSSIIALDASGEACSVSLKLPSGHIITRVSDEPRAHAAKLLPFVDQLLAEADLSFKEIDAIACAVGPGSFTGLRIALGVAQGLAFGTGLPVIPVCTLAAMAWSVKGSERENVYLPLLDARMAEVYWGAYFCSAQALNESLIARVNNAEDFHQEIRALGKKHTLVAVGTAWQQVGFAQVVLQELELSLSICAASLSEAVAELAALSDIRMAPSEVDLLYCRNSVAWDKRQRIRS